MVDQKEVDVVHNYYDSEGWFPAHYNPNISTEQWLTLLANKSVFTKNYLKIMKRFKDYGGKATCIELSLKYGESTNFYNSGSTAIAKRVVAVTGCEVMTKDTESSKWWPVLFIGRAADSKTRGSYVWKLRDELSKALDKFDLSKVPLYEEDVITKPYSKDMFLKEVYMTSERFDTLVSLLKKKKNLILQGAPGVGKTFAAKRLAYAMMGQVDEERIAFIQFHQNYSYEDFIMGYKPEGEGFHLKKGIFHQFCEKAHGSPEQMFFFIIDEINRGNMSKIFGELLMLIENDYRGENAKLAYNGEDFSVPKNLYIIGMMNTADRSLAMIDYALRRRFSFFEIEPGFESEGFRRYQEGLHNSQFNTLIDRIKDLNKEIAADNSLGKGFCIGHSYFCGQAFCDDPWMKEVVEYDVLPMLGEYWFDDNAKLQRWQDVLRGVFHD